MRTTLTLDDDVAEQPDALSKQGKIPVVSGGKWLLPDNIVSTHDMLTWAEGGAYR
ncbi:MAG: hypothetical protein LBW77_05165 [Verrucomicrobiota bacterium]|jgi:hypothetical protein|nr:hypothetical protein [Verrucomicrobiota bacterium]